MRRGALAVRQTSTDHGGLVRKKKSAALGRCRTAQALDAAKIERVVQLATRSEASSVAGGMTSQAATANEQGDNTKEVFEKQASPERRCTEKQATAQEKLAASSTAAEMAVPSTALPAVASQVVKVCTTAAPLKSCMRMRKTTPGRQNHQQKSVTFRPTVDVAEYARLLGGGGAMPSDGSWVSLGLGDKRRDLREALAGEVSVAVPSMRPGVARHGKKRVAKEELSLMPLPRRVSLLKEAMGAATFKEAWARDKAELLRLRASRNKSVTTVTAADMMPNTLKQARLKALKVEQEVQELNQQAQRAVSNKTAAAKASSRKPMAKKNCRGQSDYREMPSVAPAQRLAEKRKAVSAAGMAIAGWKGAVLAGRPNKRRKRR